MSRVESSETFIVDKPMERVLPFFKDLANIGNCIPGCEGVIPSDKNTAKFKVKMKLGYISKSINMDVSLAELKPNELTFRGTSEDARIVGRLNFETMQDGTRVSYTLSIEAASALARTWLAFMGKDFVKNQTQLFVSCVRAKIT